MNGHSALHDVCEIKPLLHEHPGPYASRIVRLLIEHGADVNLQDREGMRAIQYAVETYSPFFEHPWRTEEADLWEPYCEEGERVIRALLEAGVDIHCVRGFSNARELRTAMRFGFRCDWQFTHPEGIIDTNYIHATYLNKLMYNGRDGMGGGEEVLDMLVLCLEQRPREFVESSYTGENAIEIAVK